MNGSLQEKNGRYYMVLELGKGKQKWKSTGLKVQGNKRKAEKMLTDTLREYEEKQAAEPQKTDIAIADLIREYLVSKKGTVRANSYTSYEETAMLHLIPYFEDAGLTAQSIEPYRVPKAYLTDYIKGNS